MLYGLASERGGVMDELIRIGALIKNLKNSGIVDSEEDAWVYSFVIAAIQETPTVDAVPVEEIKNIENPYSKFIECYKCEFDGFETARRHLLLKYEEKVQE